jgi:hypothetical protein
LDSPDPPDQLVTPKEARAARPTVPEPDRLGIKEVEDSHALAMHKQERGWVGAVCGTRGEKFGNVAFLVIVACFSLIGMALYLFGLTDQFFKLQGLLLGVVVLALRYLNGGNNKR